MSTDVDISIAIVEALGGALLLFALHATVLLTAVWAIERAGALKHPGWAELAWRAALFGAFLSVAFEYLPGRIGDANAWSARERTAIESGAPKRDAAATIVDTPNMMPGNTASAESSHRVQPMPARAAAWSSTTASHNEASSGDAPQPDAWRYDRWEIDARTMSAIWLAWMLGAMAVAFATLRQAFALRRLKRRLHTMRQAASDDMLATVAKLSMQMGVRMPAVHILPDLVSPLVLPNAVLLPRWAEGLDRTQRIAMLAHELAHLRRRDPLWRPLQRIALIPLFFHPLAWRAVHRLEALAETLCDRDAVERSGSARALAECLAECMARQTEQRNPMWAVAMAERSDGIVARVHRLLEASPMSFSSIPKRWRWGAAAVVLLALMALPGMLIVVRDRTQSLSVTYRNDGTSYRVTSDMPVPGDRFHVEVEGDVEFDARESDVVRLGPGASIEIEEKRGTTSRAIRIVGKDGRIVRHYRVGEAAGPLDDEGRAWLARAIPEIYRLTGIDAERRTKRLLAAGGPMRVLAEIDAIKNDGARAEYLGQLFAQADLDDAQLTRAMTQIEAIDSDFEKRRALGIALERKQLTSAHQARLLTIAAGFNSDFERAEWLSQAVPRFEIGAEERAHWTKTLAAFDSDFEHRRTLERMVDAGRPQATAVAIALQSARGMESDFERRSLLEKAADSGIAFVDGDYMQVVDALSSDFEKREALIALIDSAVPSRERSEAILRSVRGIQSEFERGEVLDALAKKMPDDAELIRTYRTLTRDMGNEARGAAERALDRFENG